ncbi:MAG: hypothetical protein II371_04370 [Flavobacteriales bacterium]|nr:hypothetical protein [Flavobacteriales bacterium]
MKNIITLLSLISILIAGCSSTETHNILKKSGKGIDCASHYNKEKIISLWGEPSCYEANDSEFGKDERYGYNGNLITFGENGLLNGFDIENTDFSVIWGGVSLCVGDDVSTLQNIQNATIQNTSDGYFKVWIGDEFIGVSSSGGKITAISFSSSI